MLSEAVVEITGNPISSAFCLIGPFEHAELPPVGLELDAHDPLTLSEILQTT